VYVVAAGELMMEQIDSIPATQDPLLVGSILQQTGPFNNGSLNGLSGFYSQAGAPFSNASLAGTYVGGNLAPLDYAHAHGELNVGSADGLGTLTLNGDSSSPGGLDQWFGTVISYSIASNGRGTGEEQGDPAPSVVYMISPSRWIVLSTNIDARVEVFGH
jgi:hypothetical protein